MDENERLRSSERKGAHLATTSSPSDNNRANPLYPVSWREGHVVWALALKMLDAEDASLRGIRPATEADLLAAGYVPASRLQAAEAELGRLTHVLSRSHAIVDSWKGRVPYPLRESIAELSTLLASDTASPPVAPEPCSSCAGTGFYGGTRLGDDPCPKCKGEGVETAAVEPAQEAGGLERVSHQMARYRLLELGVDPDGSLVRYIDQQKERLEMVEHLLDRERHEHEETKGYRQHAEQDRDAERAQKEAAVHEVSRLQIALGKAQGEAEGHVLVRKGVEAEREALRMELDQHANLCDWANASIESALGRKRLASP